MYGCDVAVSNVALPAHRWLGVYPHVNFVGYIRPYRYARQTGGFLA